jgi:uncharacterized damage-inducible protein DinB
MRAQRARTLERLAGLGEEKMLLPAQYGQRQVNVRFLMYRFMTHETEHTLQLLKTLRALGVDQSEAQLILGRLEAVHGELEALLVGLRDQDVDRTPAQGEWSPRQVLEHIIEGEEGYAKRVQEALAGTVQPAPNG